MLERRRRGRKHEKDRWVDAHHDERDHHGFSTNDYEYLDSLHKCRSKDHRDNKTVSPVKN